MIHALVRAAIQRLRGKGHHSLLLRSLVPLPFLLVPFLPFSLFSLFPFPFLRLPPLPHIHVATAQDTTCSGTTHVVTTTADDGVGSLRAAIDAANAAADGEPQCISFQIPAADPGYDATTGVWIIRPASPLPHLRHNDLLVDGTTQTQYAGDTNLNGPEILLDGSKLASPGHGLVIAGDNITLRGLVIGGFPFRGVLVVGNSATIVGNYIGVGPDGSSDLGSELTGIYVNMAQLTRIGSEEPGDANVIGGNGEWGIFVRQSPATFIRGNIIGLGADGDTPLGNGLGGIHVDGSSSVAIGGFDDARGNVIGSNGGPGVEIDGTGGQGNMDISHNRIGTDGPGIRPRPNRGDGIRLLGGVQFVTIDSNVLSGNQGAGVHAEGGSNIIVSNNMIGVGADGITVLGNGRYGIELTAGAANNTIGPGNVIIANSVGVQVLDSYGNSVTGNRIGVDVTGQRAPGNAGHGVAILDGSHDNIIGGATPEARNLIAGNGGHGIMLIRAEDNWIIGNYIGTDETGALDLGNDGSGVMIGEAADGTVVGGSNARRGNVIAGNGRYGVEIARSSSAMVQGNRIGLTAVDAQPLGNEMGGVSLFLVINAWVGGEVDGAGNVIAGNRGDGLRIAAGGNIRVYRNIIGTDADGQPGLGNAGHGLVIESGAQEVFVGGALEDGNVIAGNGGNGVVVRGPGTARQVLTANRIGMSGHGLPVPNQGHGVLFTAGARDNRIEGGIIAFNGGDGVRVEGTDSVGNRIEPDAITANGGAGIRLIGGGNHNLAPPRITHKHVSYILGSTCGRCLVHLYADPADEGAQHLAQVEAGDDGRFEAPLPAESGPFITATATDPTTNDTSEFSAPVAFQVWQSYLPIVGGGW